MKTHLFSNFRVALILSLFFIAGNIIYAQKTVEANLPSSDLETKGKKDTKIEVTGEIVSDFIWF